jgi:hypothetical protein
MNSGKRNASVEAAVVQLTSSSLRLETASLFEAGIISLVFVPGHVVPFSAHFDPFSRPPDVGPLRDMPLFSYSTMSLIMEIEVRPRLSFSSTRSRCVPGGASASGMSIPSLLVYLRSRSVRSTGVSFR